MSEKLILMHENTPYFKLFPFLKPLGGAVTPPAAPPLPKLERCINDIKAWSSANDLKLNEDKTEVIHVSSRFRKSSDLPFVEIADVPIQPVKSARNLGVIFENDLRMDD